MSVGWSAVRWDCDPSRFVSPGRTPASDLELYRHSDFERRGQQRESSLALDGVAEMLRREFTSRELKGLTPPHSP